MKRSEQILRSLEVLNFPVLMTLGELKSRYHFLAMQYHPDCGGDEQKMAELNAAYAVLKGYMENFKFTFSEEEMNKQFPEDVYADTFRF
ncbi:MAG: J domain-containing protein [Sulfurospirillaceae bacterium]|jgi:DnaJ-class molecular chaperone|nr:J domain-containing protein [Sulfurospirillaceae bacterium]MDD2827326.1 J domain-containing protein [Sulfurospirillaceae bacterium]